jgi:hypothetical protein
MPLRVPFSEVACEFCLLSDLRCRGPKVPGEAIKSRLSAKSRLGAAPRRPPEQELLSR